MTALISKCCAFGALMIGAAITIGVFAEPARAAPASQVATHSGVLAKANNTNITRVTRRHHHRGHRHYRRHRYFSPYPYYAPYVFLPPLYHHHHGFHIGHFGGFGHHHGHH